MKFVMLKKRPVPTGWEYTGSSARRRDVSETVCCRSSPCASRWSLTFWGLRSVPGDMFTLSVKPKGTLKSRPALLAAVFTYGHMLRCSLELGGGRGAAAPFPAPCCLASRYPKPAWPGASAVLKSAPQHLPQRWQHPRHPQPLHRLGGEGEELCHEGFSLCCSKSRQVVLSWWFCLPSAYPSDSTTLRIPSCSSQIPDWPGHPPTEPSFFVDGVKSHSKTLNVNVSAITMWSWSKRSWINKAMADKKCMQE